MNTTRLVAQFSRLGARLVINPPPRRGRVPRDSGVNIRRDKLGSFFTITPPATWEDMEVVDVRPELRQLLLLVRIREGKAEKKHKYLCGHDERDWFVAAIPEAANASNVGTALEALKPALVREAQARKGIKPRLRGRRRNAAYIRQGEWFFVPAPDIDPKLAILRNEPLRRGRGKPHVAEFAYRVGGAAVYVGPGHPNGLGETEFRRRVQSGAIQANQFQRRRRNPGVYVKGRVTHDDHKTVVLDGWHRVVPNTESEADATRNLAFID